MHYNYKIKLDNIKVYLVIVISSILAGLFQGVLGLGSGLVIILALLK
jgi:uncharacterized membrane protein YfcA